MAPRSGVAVARASVVAKVLFVGLFAAMGTARALNNGVGRLPTMGYSSWNDCSSDVSEERIKNITAALLRTGLAANGYTHVDVDEGWLKGRDADGNIVSDPVKFPSGMKALGQWIHSQVVPGDGPASGQRMSFGLYTSRGTCQCSTSTYSGPGSAGHVKQDAQYFAAAGADLLKEDSCCGSQDHATAFGDYAAMRDALNATGRPIVFSLCGWRSWYAPVGASLGNQWRISGDGRNWQALATAINTNVQLARFAGPGGFNDPDLLQWDGTGSFGPNRDGWYQTELQSRSQMSMWSVMAAPLLMSADISSLSDYQLETWGNAEVIAVDQDAMARQGVRVAGQNLTGTSGTNVWGRPLSDGSWALVFVNNGPAATDIECDELCFARMPFPAPGSAARIAWMRRRAAAAAEQEEEESAARGAPRQALLAAVMLADCGRGAANQTWTRDAATGHIASAAPPTAGMCLDVWQCGSKANTPVEAYPCASARALAAAAPGARGVGSDGLNGACAGLNQRWSFNANGTITSVRAAGCRRAPCSRFRLLPSLLTLCCARAGAGRHVPGPVRLHHAASGRLPVQRRRQPAVVRRSCGALQ